MNYAAARQHMLDGQIRTSKIVDLRLIEAFGSVPRETFVPEGERPRAYLDIDLPIAGKRRMMQPMVLARLIQTAEPKPTDVALIVGVGSGYSAAILSRLVAKVVAVEDSKELFESARAALDSCGVQNVQLVLGAPSAGERKHAPYDMILLEGAVASAPQGLLEQLAEGGRMVGVLQGKAVGRATLWRKSHAGVGSRTLFDANAEYVVGFEPKSEFVF